MVKKGRILSGMRPTGRLHLGNLLGALTNWVKLQDEYECFYMIADLHVLTTDYEKLDEISKNTKEFVIDWLSCGISPKKSVIFVQSWVPEHTQLHILLSMITPLSWLERVPTYKAKILEEEGRKDLSTYGFLGYPVLQAADILLYKTNIVPVGEDQLPHLELTREIARRFNYLYRKNIFVEPEGILTETPKVIGIDGGKMSKSDEKKSICISDSPDIISKKVNKMITDPQKIKLTDIGHPEICTVFSFHKIYSKEIISEILEKCKSAKLGCVQCKKKLSDRIINSLNDIQEKRKKLIGNIDEVEKILKDGSKKAQKIASKTLEEVKKVMGL